MSYIGENTIGLQINVSVGFDISSGTLTLEVLRPDHVKASWAVVVDSGPGGTAHHTTVDGDLPCSGTYSVRYKWAPTGGGAFYGTPTTFTVASY